MNCEDEIDVPKKKAVLLLGDVLITSESLENDSLQVSMGRLMKLWLWGPGAPWKDPEYYPLEKYFEDDLEYD